MPCLRPLNQTARAVFPQAAFLRCSTMESSRDETGNQMRLPLPPFRCVWVLLFHGLRCPSVGSFAQGTLQPSSTSSPLPSVSHAQQSTGPSPSAGSFAPSSAATRGSGPRLFAVTSFLSSMPRSDSWHRFGRNFAPAYIRAYLPVAPGRCLCSLFPALSSAGVP